MKKNYLFPYSQVEIEKWLLYVMLGRLKAMEQHLSVQTDQMIIPEIQEQILNQEEYLDMLMLDSNSPIQ